MKKAVIFFTILFASVCSIAFCDTIHLKDSSSVKGIIVEEYRDRVVVSTEYGERDMSKNEIRSISYDLPEQNLCQMAKKYQEKKDYVRAYYYFDKARKINPDFKEARDGCNYLHGFLFRKELGTKKEEVDWMQEIEDFGRLKSESGRSLSDQLKATIGIEVDTSGKDIIVKRVYKGLPADEAGMKEGDALSAIWGKLSGYLEEDEIAAILTKPENLEAKISVDRLISYKAGSITAGNLSLEFEGLVLKNVNEGSAAFINGFRNGDIVLSIDGESIRYTTIDQVVGLLKRRPKNILIRRDLTIWRKV